MGARPFRSSFGRLVLVVVALYGLPGAVAGAQPPVTSTAPGHEVDPSHASSEASDDATARQIFLRGREAYKRGHFAEALRAFRDAYRLAAPDRRVLMLLNIAQALDRLGREEEALDHYERYVAQAPEGPNIGVARGRIRVLRARMVRRARREEALRRREEAARRREQAARQALMEARRKPERGLSTTWILAGVGGALLVGGAVTAAILLRDDTGTPPFDVGGDVRFREVLLRTPRGRE